jgi:hypothetical protein
MREPSECLEKKHAANLPSWRANCRFFYTDKILGGQDRAFLFWDGLMNYEELQSTLYFILVQAPSIR